MDFQTSTGPDPFMRNAVQDNAFNAGIFTQFDGFNVIFRCEGFLKGEDVITSQMGIEIGRSSFSIHHSDLTPVSC